MIPLSLYVHLPWCVRKCPYCDFNSHTAGPAADKERYIAALVRDLDFEAQRAGRRVIETVFFGGGTPSFFGASEIGTILGAIAASFELARDAEITMEANPGTVERGRLRDYRLAGIDRLSLGAQSFDAVSLRRLGRIHGPEEISSAFRDAANAGFDSINVDLMYALPGQTPAMAAADLARAIELSPHHISWYQLTLEPNTRFHAHPPADLPGEDLVFAMEQQGYELLHAAGFEQYETSAFAQPGRRCRHNLNYWQFGDYLAVGAGAHGKFTDESGRIWRYRKPAHPLSYMQASETGLQDSATVMLAAPDLAFEYMLNVLRLRQGFTASQFTARTGLPFGAVSSGIERARQLGLLEEQAAGPGVGFVPTERGRRFLNDLQALFLPPPGAGGKPEKRRERASRSAA